jgi:hypothetical protein
VNLIGRRLTDFAIIGSRQMNALTRHCADANGPILNTVDRSIHTRTLQAPEEEPIPGP